jgi:SynChlorMet cassette protein ScmC
MHPHPERYKLTIGSQHPAFGMILANGICWKIVADNAEAGAFVERLARVMQLDSANGSDCQIMVRVHNGGGSDCFSSTLADSQTSCFMEVLTESPWEESNSQLKRSVFYRFPQNGNETSELLPLIQLSSVLTLDAMTRGGMLLHGALIERDGMGMILAGPGGIGKTTACSRLPETWTTLSDDSTLIVRDPAGDYWAHPWPTWSSFFYDGVGGSWDVQSALPLKAVFFLAQADRDRIQAVDQGKALCLLLEHTQHFGFNTLRDLDDEKVREIQLQRFDNACALVKVIPSYRLWISLAGTFWNEIEREVLHNEVV